MLAQAVISPYQYAADFHSPADYLTYMFGDKDGFFSRNLIRKGIMRKEYFVRKDTMMQLRWSGLQDCYISQNSFLTPRKNDTPNSGRKVENLKRLNALYVDIDCYTVGLSKDAVLYALNEMYDREIPYPTFVIDSGKGLYLIYKIDEDRNALPRWQAVEEYLVDKLLPLGADLKAKDAARILRVPGTVNSKNGETVKILSFANIQYSLYDIIREYDIVPNKTHPAQTKTGIRKDGLPCYAYGQATEKQRRTARWISTELEIPLPDFESFQETFDYIDKHLHQLPCNRLAGASGKPLNLPKRTTLKAMLQGRMDDLRQLFAMRKGEDCCREYGLFLFRHWHLLLHGDPQKALEDTLSFNATLDRPFSDEYVIKTTRSAQRKYDAESAYYYSTKTIVAELRISDEEQVHMKYLCGYPENQRERKKRANRRGYLLRLEKEGRQEKKESIQSRREKIAAMLAVGRSKAEICAALNLSARTFDRDKAAIIADGLIEKVKAEIAQIAAKAEKAASAVKAAVSACSASVRGASPFFQHPYYNFCTSIASAAIPTPSMLGEYTDTGQPRAP